MSGNFKNPRVVHCSWLSLSPGWGWVGKGGLEVWERGGQRRAQRQAAGVGGQGRLEEWASGGWARAACGQRVGSGEGSGERTEGPFR